MLLPDPMKASDLADSDDDAPHAENGGRGVRDLIPDGVRPALRFVRWLPERSLHARRRAAALDRLRSIPEVRSVLVLCLGNICRSPYAAVLLENRTGGVPGGVRIVSAGFLRPDRPSPTEAIEVAAPRGVDLRPHRSRKVDAGMMLEADLIIVMDPEHAQRVYRMAPSAAARVLMLGETDPRPFQRRLIPDPYGGDRAVFEECYDRIDRCVVSLSRLLWPR